MGGPFLLFTKKVMKETTKTAKTVASPKLTKKEIASAAFNDSTLSTDTIQLGDRTFPIKHLSYDQYNKFLVLISPLADGLINRIGNKVQAEQLGIEDLDVTLFSVKDIFQYCGDNLPELALISIQASDPTVTVEKLKELAGTPFKLAEVVLLQLMKNNTVKDFSDFFGRILPLLKS